MDRSGKINGSKINGPIENKWTDLAGADYLATIPHAPWPSRSMLKRRIVLGSKQVSPAPKLTDLNLALTLLCVP